MELTVDSSVFVSSLHEADPSFRESRQALELIGARGDHITIPSLVVMEVASALAHTHASPTRKEWDDLFHTFTVIPLDDKFASYFAEFVRANLTSLKTSDEIIVFAAQHARTTLVTLDRQMLAHGSKFVRALTPQQYLALP